jgi:diguanylate cyclase (GGDEF)-like protein/PAS domain S-box-containing protein
MTDLPGVELLFEHLADAVYLIDPASSNIIWGNRAAWAGLGLTREEVVNHSVLSLQKDVSGLPHWSEIAAVIRAGECFTFVGRHRHKDGHEVAVEVNTTHFQLDGREYFLSVARDVRRRIALEADLHARENQLWFALNEAADGLWDWEVASGNLFFSPQLKRMLGYGPDEMEPVLSTWSDNVHPEDGPRVMALLNDHLAGRLGRYQAEYRLRNRNGHYLWVHDRGKVCARDAQGNPQRVVGMVQDISDRKQLELQLQALASSDMLTGLPNRRQGTAFLESELELCRRVQMPLGLCFFDIDLFKAVNDRHGHLVGDLVIQRVAGIVAGAIRKSDMVCRWGGEEFIIVSPNSTLEQTLLVAEKVRLTVMQTMAASADAIPAVTISLGVSSFPEHARDIRELFEKADVALYRAKDQGRNRVEVCLG